MTTQNPQQYEGRTDTDAAVDAGLAAAIPHDLGDGSGLHVLTVPAGATHVVIDPEKETAWREERPRRKTGKRTAHDPESLVRYVQRHGTPDTEVWADKVGRSVVAVLDGHGTDAPGHGDHRITLGVDRSESWKRWKSNDGVQMGQGQFADFIEQAAAEVVEPDAATLLQIAQTITGHRAVSFESAERTDNGDVTVSWKENTSAQAGKDGKLTIPSTLLLRIRPFVGGAAVDVQASLRYRVSKEGVTLGYVLINPDRVEEFTFDLYVQKIAGALAPEGEGGFPVFYGKPIG